MDGYPDFRLRRKKPITGYTAKEAIEKIRECKDLDAKKKCVENLPLASINQGIKLLKDIYGRKLSPYYDILKSLNVSLKNITARSFYHDEELAYIKINTKLANRYIQISDTQYPVIQVERICINSLMLSLLSRRAIRDSEKINELKMYSKQLSFSNKQISIHKQKLNQSQQNQRKNLTSEFASFILLWKPTGESIRMA